jgi:hypothetical protein
MVTPSLSSLSPLQLSVYEGAKAKLSHYKWFGKRGKVSLVDFPGDMQIRVFGHDNSVEQVFYETCYHYEPESLWFIDSAI